MLEELRCCPNYRQDPKSSVIIEKAKRILTKYINSNRVPESSEPEIQIHCLNIISFGRFERLEGSVWDIIFDVIPTPDKRYHLTYSPTSKKVEIKTYTKDPEIVHIPI